MADQRIINSVHVTDPTTSTQQMGVDASGHAQVDIAADSSGLMKTTNFSDVLGTVSLITTTQADNLANTTDTLNTSALLYVFDGSTWDRLLGNATDGMLVNLGTNNDVAVTSQIPGTGATNLGKAIDTAVGATDTGVGSLFKRVDTPGTITPADGNWAPGQLDSQGYLRVKDPNAGSGSPTSPIREAASTSALAAGSAARVDHSTDLGGLTRKLTQVTISGSRAFKAVIQETENGAVVQDKDVVFSPGGGGSVIWTPPHKDYLSTAFSANAGFDGFSVTFTNLDSADAADFYATFYWET